MHDEKEKETERAAEISKIKTIIDEALASNYTIPKLRGKITTNTITTSLEVTPELLVSMCGNLTDGIQLGTAHSGINFDKSVSSDEDENGHVYLTTGLQDGSELIVDPSIGQFIEGHNHVFVGTRVQLHDLVTNQTGKNKKYKIINTRSRNSPEEAFCRIWGEKRMAYGTQMSNPEHRARYMKEVEE